MARQVPCFLILTIFYLGILNASQTNNDVTGISATTDDGRRVILKMDGSWEYEEIEKIDSDLAYQDSTVEISFESARLTDKEYIGIYTWVALTVSVKSKTKIVEPYFRRYYTSNELTGEVSSSPRGFYLRDSFGNRLELRNTYQGEYNPDDGLWSNLRRSEEKKIRPLESVKMELGFEGYPLETAPFVVLSVDAGTLGNENDFVINIPSEKIVRLNEIENMPATPPEEPPTQIKQQYLQDLEDLSDQETDRHSLDIESSQPSQSSNASAQTKDQYLIDLENSQSDVN